MHGGVGWADDDLLHHSAKLNRVNLERLGEIDIVKLHAEYERAVTAIEDRLPRSREYSRGSVVTMSGR